MSRRPSPGGLAGSSGVFLSPRAIASRAASTKSKALLDEDSLGAARSALGARLELARARHYLERTLDAIVEKRTKSRVGSALGDEAMGEIVRFLGGLRAPTTRGGRRRSHSEVQGMTHFSVAGDLPPELAAYSDGVTDDGAYHPEIIGCDCAPSVGAGLGDLAVGALPWYVFSKKGVSSPVARRRFAAALKALPPKTRRRVMTRLRAVAAQRAHVSGAVSSAYPTVGWSGVSVAGKHGCPLSGIAGALTP